MIFNQNISHDINLTGQKINETNNGSPGFNESTIAPLMEHSTSQMLIQKSKLMDTTNEFIDRNS